MNQAGIESQSSGDVFVAGAYRRIQTALIVCTVIGSGLGIAIYGRREGFGVMVGGGVAFINFLWLKRSMIALTDAVSMAAQIPPKPTLVLRFFLRYALLAAIGYAIIYSSAISAYGVMWGLLLSVPALMFEVICEIWYALKHGE